MIIDLKNKMKVQNASQRLAAASVDLKWWTHPTIPVLTPAIFDLDMT